MNMEAIQQSLSIRFEYAVHFTEGLFREENPLLRRVLAPTEGNRSRALFVVDAGVAEAHPDLCAAIGRYCALHADAPALAAAPLLIPGGEPVKNDPAHVAALQQAIHDARLCRHSFVVAVGGGAVLDAVGYAAATAHRGVRHVRVPTTVLSQNDSGVGVKNGINAFGKKNYLGTFATPWAVINDFAFLTTLDDRDWRSGISEAVKVALIKDSAFFDQIERDAEALAARSPEPMHRLIHRCARLHVEHIGQGGDPFEMGSSRPLDFGHWSAHKLEALTGYRLRHGEAVAIGIALDCAYAMLVGLLPAAAFERVAGLLDTLGFATYVPEMATGGGLPAGLTEFQEHLGGRLTLLMLRGIGQVVEVHDVDLGAMDRAAALLRSRSARTPN